MKKKDKENYKKMILNHLEFKFTPTYRRYGIKLEEFLVILWELKNEHKINYDIIVDMLPDGNPSPFYGEPKNIRLYKDNVH
jgi:hypothetical protein